MAGFRLTTMFGHTKHVLRPKSLHNTAAVSPVAAAANSDHVVPKGHVAVYVGENYQNQCRFVVPVSYVNHPMFRELLRQAEEENGFEHPMGGLTIPCSKNTFLSVTSQLNES